MKFYLSTGLKKLKCQKILTNQAGIDTLFPRTAICRFSGKTLWNESLLIYECIRYIALIDN